MYKEIISVVILVLNEEKNIKSCLKSVSWADEIVITDTGSVDNTLDIAQEYTNKIYYFTFNKNYGKLREEVSKLIKNDWILMVDADETISVNAEKIIRKLIKEPNYDGYLFPRRNYITDKTYLRNGYFYPDYQLRLFRNNGKIKYSGKIHEKPIIPQDKTKIINNVIIRHNPSHSKYDSFFHFYRFFRYVSIEGKIIAEKNILTLRFLYLIPLVFVRHFWRSFVKLSGYKDGFPGFRAALIYSVYQGLVLLYALNYRIKTKLI